MSNDSGFPTQEEVDEMVSDEPEEPEEVSLEVIQEVEEVEEDNRPIAAEPKNQDEIFEKPEPKKKKKRQLTQKQLDALAKAREKGLAKRRALSLARKKEAEMKKLEKTRHIRERKKKKMDEEALIMAHAEEEHERKEKAAWDEEKLVSLMNRTMDTYFETRAKKKAERQTVPAPPQGYYVPAQPPPMERYIPKEKPKPKKPTNPYYSMFGLVDSD